jgi:hypothetical protein
VSDWVNLAWTTSDGLLISYCWGSPEGGAVNTSGLASGNETNFYSSNQTATLDATADQVASDPGGTVEAIILVETQAGGGAAVIPGALMPGPVMGVH